MVEQQERCPTCGRFVKAKDPRRSLIGNGEKKYHGHAGATHDDDSKSVEAFRLAYRRTVNDRCVLIMFEEAMSKGDDE